MKPLDVNCKLLLNFKDKHDHIRLTRGLSRNTAIRVEIEIPRSDKAEIWLQVGYMVTVRRQPQLWQ